MPSISFHTDGVDYLLRHKHRIRATLEAMATSEGAEIERIDYILCGKPQIKRINIYFLNHHYYTDIITFPYQQGEVVESDIYICIPVIRENAKRFGTKTYQELVRVIFHGLLHMLGYDDHSTDDAREMRRQEDRWLKYFNELE